MHAVGIPDRRVSLRGYYRLPARLRDLS